MRGRHKVSHASKQRRPPPKQDRRKRSREQTARLDAVFKKPASSDVDPLDGMPLLIVDPDAYQDP